MIWVLYKSQLKIIRKSLRTVQDPVERIAESDADTIYPLGVSDLAIQPRLGILCAKKNNRCKIQWPEETL